MIRTRRTNSSFWLAAALACSFYLGGQDYLGGQGWFGMEGGLAFAQPSAPAENSTVDEEELAKDSTAEINVKNADIAAIVRIFSRKTKRNYILDDRVKGKVSIYLPGRVSAEESVRILDSVLNYKGFAAVPIGENLWKIVPSKEARQSTIPTQIGATQNGETKKSKPSAEMVTRLLQLKYVSADDVKQLVSQIVSPDGFVTAYAATNSLIIIDAEDNVDRIASLINALDISETDRDMTIIPVVYADAVQLADKLNEILGIGSGSGHKDSQESGLDLLQARIREATQQINRPPGMPNSPASNMGASSGVQALARQPKITADQRTNSIIVVADEDTTARVRALISQLDSKLDLAGAHFYVYRCQHASAEELVDVLSGLSGQGGGSGRSRSSTSDNTESNSGMASRSGLGSRGGSSQNRLRSQQRTPGHSRNENGAQTVNGGAALGEDVSITADPATNSLIIFAGKSDYEKIVTLLRQLDIRRRQVLVEAMLLEVGIDDTQRMSSSFVTSAGGADGGLLAQNNGQDITQLLANPSAIQDFSVAAASKGTITIGGGSEALTIPSQTLLLKAAQSNSDINVLSAPTILTTDNEQAEIVVGQNVPFVSSTATNAQNLNNTFNQVDRQDVGITLRLTPQISAGETVLLKIFTEVSSVQSTDPNLGPTTSIRTSDTSVITKDNQMVVIGGLMSDSINTAESGVPFLKDIPVLGHLFRSLVDERKKTNLLILITPRIVRDQYDARDLTVENRNAMHRELKREDIYPNRDEVLFSDKIDKVSEPEDYNGAAPTTITAPERRSNGQAVRSLQRSDSAPAADSSSSAAAAPVLEFKVNPQFPGDAEQKSAGKQAGQPEAAAQTDADSYLVLQIAPKQTIGSDLPFAPTKDGKYIGIKLPAGSPNAAREFFSAGSQSIYRYGKHELHLQMQGAFTTKQAAKALFPQSDLTWYTLSPYELMELGNGPWLKSTK